MASPMSKISTCSTGRDLVGVVVVLLHPSHEQDQHRYEQLQQLRREHDDAYDRWLPHITLIPPFILAGSSNDHANFRPPESVLSEISQAAQEVCTRHQSHVLLLDQVSTFPLRSHTNVHLRPYPTNFADRGTHSGSASPAHSSQRLVELQRQLFDAVGPILRSARTKADRKGVFRPHASVGQSYSRRSTWQLCTSAEKVLHFEGGAGLLCDIDLVQLMTKVKGEEGPYRIHAELPLAS